MLDLRPHIMPLVFERRLLRRLTCCTPRLTRAILKIWDQSFKRLAMRVRHGFVSTLLARNLAAVTAVEVVLSGVALQNFPRARDFYARSQGVVGFLFCHTV